MIFLTTLFTVTVAITAYAGAMVGFDRLANVLPGRLQERARVVVFVGPALLLVAIGLVIPGIRTIVNSFFDNSPAARRFVWFENYGWIFSTRDGLITIRNNVLWVLIVPFISTVIGLAVATLADKYRGEAIAKAIIFLPNAISLAGAGIVWKFVYAYKGPKEPQIGVLNKVWVGLGGDPVRFVSDRPWNNLYLMVAMIWIQAGFATVVLSAAIKGVPSDYLEAARIDGANEGQVFRRVLLPSIRPTLVVVMTTITIAVLKAFDIVKSMTGGNFETDVVASALMQRTFSFGQYGYGAALTVILFVAVIPIMFFNLRQYRSEMSR